MQAFVWRNDALNVLSLDVYIFLVIDIACSWIEHHGFAGKGSAQYYDLGLADAQDRTNNPSHLKHMTLYPDGGVSQIFLTDRPGWQPKYSS